jgi:GNAT superfamily N-acetyltransferase
MIAGLWRELWDAHEGWGGYRASHDPRTYDELAVRLDEDARVRASHPVLGRHVHLVASSRGRIAGQVEGWFERHGVDPTTPFTCEVRSLIVTAFERRSGAGRALVDMLAATARELAKGGQVVLAAEVLEPNPAFAFYERAGFAPVSWSTRVNVNPPPLASQRTPSPPRISPPSHEGVSVRVAHPKDALAVGVLESFLAARRRGLGDVRYDRPRAVDAKFVGAIAAHFGTASRQDGPVELVACDRHGNVTASASFAVGMLEAPFVPSRRAVMGRFAVDPSLDPTALIAAMVSFGKRLAAQRSVPYIELTDLTPPDTPVYQATLAASAVPWSRIYCKVSSS